MFRTMEDLASLLQLRHPTSELAVEDLPTSLPILLYNRHYGEYFARFYAMILCSFGILIVGAGPYASGSLQAERQWGIDVHIGG